MKALPILGLIALVSGTPAFGQPAPNRQGEVAQILSDLPRAAKTEADDGRRANLFAIVRGLAARGDCCWGVLVKTDQANKIPADVIVWRPTLEHFDVITGAGDPYWQAHGPVSNAAWLWQAVPGADPPPPSTPPPSNPPAPPPSTPACDLGGLVAELQSVVANQQRALEQCAKVASLETDVGTLVQTTSETKASLEEHRAEARKVKGLFERFFTARETWIAIAVALGGYVAKLKTAGQADGGAAQ